VELARRASGGAEGTTYGDPLAKLADEIEADRRALESIMDKFGFGADRAKNLAFWAAEKAGRLKPNGQLTGASPLSRLVELEIAPNEPRLDEEGLRQLVERGQEQLGIVEGLRDRAAGEALPG
jgi:hypothetical protein